MGAIKIGSGFSSITGTSLMSGLMLFVNHRYFKLTLLLLITYIIYFSFVSMYPLVERLDFISKITRSKRKSVLRLLIAAGILHEAWISRRDYDFVGNLLIDGVLKILNHLGEELRL